MSVDLRSASRLPDDPGYWQELAARSIAAAHPPRWWTSLSDAAYVLAASAVLALLAGGLLLGDRTDGATLERGTIRHALAPEDPLLRSLLASSAVAPAPATLLTLVAARQEER